MGVFARHVSGCLVWFACLQEVSVGGFADVPWAENYEEQPWCFGVCTSAVSVYGLRLVGIQKIQNTSILLQCPGSCILTSEARLLGVVSTSPHKLRIQVVFLQCPCCRGSAFSLQRPGILGWLFPFLHRNLEDSLGSCTLTSEARSLGVVVPIFSQKLGTQCRQLHCIFRGQVTLGS